MVETRTTPTSSHRSIALYVRAPTAKALSQHAERKWMVIQRTLDVSAVERDPYLCRVNERQVCARLRNHLSNALPEGLTTIKSSA